MKYYKVCRVRCRLCGDVLEHVNQSKTERSSLMLCSCRKVGLDPAAVMYRTLGNPEDYEDLSEPWPEEWTTWEDVRNELFTPEEKAASDKRVAVIGERLKKGEQMSRFVRWFMFRIVWPAQDWWFYRTIAKLEGGDKHEHSNDDRGAGGSNHR